LREAARRAADQGMVLALENMEGQWADTAENTRKVLEAVAHLAYRLNWDPANAVRAGDTTAYPKGYEAVKQYMVHFHLKNIIRTAEKADWSVIPTGDIDYNAHLRQVIADGYRGWYVIETHYEPILANSRTNLDYLLKAFGAGTGEKSPRGAQPAKAK
jgi:sugar phosphate isomerase/epimerase